MRADRPLGFSDDRRVDMRRLILARERAGPHFIRVLGHRGRDPGADVRVALRVPRDEVAEPSCIRSVFPLRRTSALLV